MDKRKGSKKSQNPKGAKPVPGAEIENQKTTSKAPSITTTTKNLSLKRPIESISQAEPSPFDIPFPSNLTQSTPNPPFAANQLPSLPANLSITSINIISSSSIESKVTTSLKVLSLYPAERPPVVVFTAKADVASKMISIVEIVKRNLAGEGGKWFEYIAVDAQLVEKKKQAKKKGDEEGGKEKGAVEEGDEEDAFEVMKTPFERIITDRPKVRSIPVMAIYLSRVRIDDLRKKHGEQTNAEPAARDT